MTEYLTDQQIEGQAQAAAEYLVRCRRALHSLAEPSGQEEKTSAFVHRELEQMGLPVERVGAHGLIATLDTGRPGPRLVLRADLDALPINENPNNLAGPRSCISATPGVCHACGHDAHSAMLLGTARALLQLRGQLCGVLYLCFEEGEEVGAGLADMLRALSGRRPDACWALHVYAALDSGKLCVAPGPRMAGATRIDLTVQGRSGHGSRPDLAINPVFCAAAIATNAATAWVNQIATDKPVTLAISSIQGGVQGNIIPDSAHMLGTMRFFYGEEGDKAIALIRTVAEHTAAMNRCTVSFGPTFGSKTDPVVNDPACTARVNRRLARLMPDALADCPPWYASESFSYYCSRWPCVFGMLGIKNAACGSGAEHHNEYFDVDEAVLPLGVKATLGFVAAMAEGGQEPPAQG